MSPASDRRQAKGLGGRDDWTDFPVATTGLILSLQRQGWNLRPAAALLSSPD